VNHLAPRADSERYVKRYVLLGMSVTSTGTHFPFVGLPLKAFEREQVQLLLYL
jgi:hypothetical protein